MFDLSFMVPGIKPRESWPLMRGNPDLYLASLRNARNAGTVYAADRLAWPDGKKAFDDFVIAEGDRAPRTVAQITDGKLLDPVPAHGPDLASWLAALPDGDYFCKPDHGINGRGALRLDVRAGRLILDGVGQDHSSVQRLLASQPYLVQDSLVPHQHPEIARFTPSVLSTFRLVTFDGPGGPVPFHAGLRLATTHASVDNWSAGGIYIPVDLDTGAMRPHGLVKDGLALVERHPPSDLQFRDQRLPGFSEAVALACRLHSRLAVASLGWDLAMLRDGPCVVECNRNWDVYLPEDLEPDYVPQFLRFHLPERREAAVRIKLSGDFADANLVRRWLSLALGQALVHGRVDSFSGERLVLSVAGSKAGVARAIELLAKSAVHFRLRDFKASRTLDDVAPGLDIAGTFSGC